MVGGLIHRCVEPLVVVQIKSIEGGEIACE